MKRTSVMGQLVASVLMAAVVLLCAVTDGHAVTPVPDNTNAQQVVLGTVTRPKKESEKDVPAVEIQINVPAGDATEPDENDDYACITNSPGLPTVICRAKLRQAFTQDVTVVMVDIAGGGEVRFPGATDTTKTLVLDKDGSTWTNFYISGSTVSSTTNDAKIEARLDTSSGKKLGEQELTVLKVELRELSFTNNFTIKSDNGTTDYTQPHWQDPNGDGIASDGHAYPLCYTRNTKMKLTVGKWHVEPANPPVTIKIKGDGPGNLDFPETTAMVSGNDVTISNVECSASFANEIDFFDPLSVDWEASIDGGSSWFTAGRSTNQTYVTLGNPSTNVPLYHTLLHVGCKNADGETTADGAVAAIWPDFEDRIVARVDGQTLYYYKNAVPTSSSADLAGLLATADGQCTAWAQFFNGVLLVQGITDGGVQVACPKSVALWDANDATNATVTNVMFNLHMSGILVKHWSLLNASWATNDTNHNCIPDSTETEFPDVIENWVPEEGGNQVVSGDFLLPYKDSVPLGSYEGLSDIKTTGTGLKGQGDIVPSAQIFNQHFVVTRGYTYGSAESYTIYDPCYGKKYEGVDAVNQWKTNALDGFFQRYVFGGTNSYIEVAPNDGNCLIGVTLYPEANYIGGIVY